LDIVGLIKAHYRLDIANRPDIVQHGCSAFLILICKFVSKIGYLSDIELFNCTP